MGTARLLVEPVDDSRRRIKVCAKEMVVVTERPSVGATVRCYDKDINKDDFMTEGTTDEDGCVNIYYEKKNWDGFIGSSPDIYCTVNKPGYVESTPMDKDHHGEIYADFGNVTLFRDRSNDYGYDNGCGPYLTEFVGLNDFATWATRFGDQCTMHNKCYYDYNIFIAKDYNADEAREFCDYEFYEGMKSSCVSNRGKLPGVGEDLCLTKADLIYGALQSSVAKLFYDLTESHCRSNKNGTQDPSMDNDYSHDKDYYYPPLCHVDGSKCGMDGVVGRIFDDLKECENCCSSGSSGDNGSVIGSGFNNYTNTSNVDETEPVIHEGLIWDDHYCECFPRGVKCGSTLLGNRFNKCDKCCSGQTKVDDFR